MKKSKQRQTCGVSFSDAFYISCKLLLEAPQLFKLREGFSLQNQSILIIPRLEENPTNIEEDFITCRNRKLVYQLETKLTPKTRLSKIARDRKITSLVLQYKETGPHLNIQRLIDWLREQGALTVERSGGVFHKLDDRTARLILTRTLGIKGMPGRKPRNHGDISIP